MGERTSLFLRHSTSMNRSRSKPDTASSSSSMRSYRSSAASRSTTSTNLTLPGRLNTLTRRKSSERISTTDPRKPARVNRGTGVGEGENEEEARSLEKPPFIFSKLPDEVLNCIVEHILRIDLLTKYQHVLNDLSSLSLTCLRWHKVTSPHLYHTFWIPKSSFHTPPRRFLSRPKSKVKLLYRTLQEKPRLADHVRDIHILDYTHTSNHSAKELIVYSDALASIVASCPELERLTGFHPVYHHKHDAIFHAISTRPKLKDHAWILGPNCGSMSGTKNPRRRSPLRPALEEGQITAFVELHSRFERLETLAITCLPDGTCDGAFFTVFGCMPALRNLHLSALGADFFGNSQLQHLPSTLRSLRLESLPGVSEQALLEYFSQNLTLNERNHLRRLSLIDMDIHSLPSIAMILDLFYNLNRLVLITSTMFFPLQDKPEEILHPYMSSSSLQHLYWEHGNGVEISDPKSTKDQYDDVEAILTNSILAESILAEGFPNLQTLFSPIDPDGTLQSVCKPISRPVFRAAAAAAAAAGVTEPNFKPYFDPNSPPPAPLIHRAKSAKTDSPPIENQKLLSRDHKKAHAATAYHRAATALHPRRRTGHDQELGFKYSVLEDLEPYMTVYVHDDTGELEAMFEFAPFVGRMGRDVPEYVLLDGEPCDAGAGSVKGVVGLDDVLESGGKMQIRRLFC